MALSFARAHQGWLRERYQRLAFNPRRRNGFSYMLGHDNLSGANDGSSAGAAYVGESRIVWNDHFPNHTYSSLILCGSRISIQVI